MSKLGDAFKNLLSAEDDEITTVDEVVITQGAEETEMVDTKLEEAAVESAVESVKASVRVAVEEAVRDAIAEAKGTVTDAIQEVVEDTNLVAIPPASQPGKEESREARPHAFVVMPFGKKKGFDGTEIDLAL
mgnify:FL=1